jgi:DNA invertase Pin-like site-specific DNA recombinase
MDAMLPEGTSARMDRVRVDGETRADLIHVAVERELARREGEITARCAFLKVITNPELDTNTPVGRLMCGMLAIFAQFEQDQIRERSAAGLKAVRECGHMGGWPPKITEDQVKAAICRNDKGEYLSDIAIKYGVSRNGSTNGRWSYGAARRRSCDCQEDH